MKNSITYLFCIFCLIIQFFSGCKEQDDYSVDIQSTINGNEVEQIAVSLNTTVNYEFSIRSEGKIGNIELIKKINGVESTIPIVGSHDGIESKVSGSVIVTSEIQLMLVAYDQKGIYEKSRKSISLKIFATTTLPTEITLNSAKSGGILADVGDNYTARGVCWSKTQNPTIELSTKTNDGTGAGTFVSELKNLSPGTTYFVRSYAIGTKGVAYGNELSFTTLSPPVPAIPNGGFESPTISGFAMNPTSATWTFTGGGSGIQRNGSAFGASNAPEGAQTALFQGGGVEISQTIDFPTAYNLAIVFMAAQRGTQQQDFEVYFDNALVGKCTPASASFELFQTNTFYATVGKHLITIKGVNTKGGDNSGFIDDVKLVYKPE